MPLYRKLSPGLTLIGSAPNLTSSRSQILWSAAQGTPIPAPLLDLTGSNKGGILLQVGFLGARALGARATCLGQPGRTPGRVGMVWAWPSWALSLVMPYTGALLKNRAQSVKAKLHIWQNPMEPYLNMNPSATRTHMTFRYP